MYHLDSPAETLVKKKHKILKLYYSVLYLLMEHFPHIAWYLNRFSNIQMIMVIKQNSIIDV